jgi:hypothetical protein
MLTRAMRGWARSGTRAGPPFPHPTLGAVEIGGCTRHLLRNPPPGPFFERVAVDQARFAVVAALATPLVRIRDASGVVVCDRGSASAAARPRTARDQRSTTLRSFSGSGAERPFE